MSMNPFDLSGKLVLITGGGSGLGLATAQAVVDAGGRAVITGRNEDKLKAAAASLGKNAGYVVNDIAELETIPTLARTVEEEYGPIYGLMNNAGISCVGKTLETDDDTFAKLLDIHVRGAFALTRECVPYMQKRKEGSIIFICSMASRFGMKNCPAYTAAKSALHGMSRGLAMDFAADGIRVNSIAPGFIVTDMTNGVNAKNPGRKAYIESNIPMGYYGQPEDIAWAALYLLSPAGRYVTGTEIVVDGGASNAGV